MKRKTGMGAAAAVLLCAGVVRADTLHLEFSSVFPGKELPGGAGPWVTAVFDDEGSAGSVKLTVTVQNLTGPEHIKDLYFNLSPFVDVAITHTGGVAPSQMLDKEDDFKADGDGLYDIYFDFFTKGATSLVNGDTSTFMITGTDITASSFLAYSQPDGGWSLPLLAAAHMGGTPGLEGSTWISATLVPLPTPVYLGLAGLGLAAGVSGIKRRR